MKVQIQEIGCILSTGGTIVDCETPSVLCKLCKYYGTEAFSIKKLVTALELRDLIREFNYVIKVILA